jgi:hypothetical protein
MTFNFYNFALLQMKDSIDFFFSIRLLLHVLCIMRKSEFC